MRVGVVRCSVVPKRVGVDALETSRLLPVRSMIAGYLQV